MSTVTFTLIIIIIFITIGSVIAFCLLIGTYQSKLNDANEMIDSLQNNLDKERIMNTTLRARNVKEEGTKRHYANMDLTAREWELMSDDERAFVKWQLAKIIAKRIVKWHEPFLTRKKNNEVIMYDFNITERKTEHEEKKEA